MVTVCVTEVYKDFIVHLWDVYRTSVGRNIIHLWDERSLDSPIIAHLWEDSIYSSLEYRLYYAICMWHELT